MSALSNDSFLAPVFLRVLMVCQPTSGGAARHVADLAGGLAARGCSVTVACPPGGVLPARLGEIGVSVVELPMSREIRPLSDLKAAFELWRLCRRLRPDVVHSHSSKAGFLGRVVGRLAGVRVVAFTPHCWSFQSVEGGKRDLYVWLERLASRFCDVTIAVSRQEAEEAIALRVVKPRRVRVIHNGLSSDELASGVARRSRARTSFVAIGRLEGQKGFRYLIDAMAELSRSEPEARLSIVGDGSLRAELQEQVASLGLAGSVRFEGEQADVKSFLRDSSVFVLSSLWEGLPYTILEAMAAGLPVVSTNVGGCPELVEPEVTGLLVPPRDGHALAEAMLRLWTQDAERVRFGAAGAQRAKREFRLDHSVIENQRAFVECLEQKGAANDQRYAPLHGARVALVAMLVIGLAWAGVDQLAYSGKIFPGVRVGAADVGGLTVDQAHARLAALTSLPVTVSITASASPAPLESSDMALNTAAALDTALSVGRVGSLPQRIGQRWEALRGETAVPVLAADSGVVAEVLDGAQKELDRAAVQTRFERRDGRVAVVAGQQGARTDQIGFRRMLGTAATSPQGPGRQVRVPVVPVLPSVSGGAAANFLAQAEKWTARSVLAIAGDRQVTLSPEQITSLLEVSGGKLSVSETNLGRVLEDAGLPTTRPKNARFVVNNGTVGIVEGTAGYAPDSAATARSLQSQLEAGGDRFAVALERMEPDVTGKDLAALGVTSKLSTFTTRFRLGQDGRDANISLAASAVQGKVLGIGEVFSLNQATGPRNAATGYKEALVFSNGKVVPGVGGGVCQVSSTLYEAALLSGLEIVERQNHSMRVSYVDPGRDATTFYPTVDLKFRNSTSRPILLWSEVSGDKLTMSVYGGGKPQDVRVETVVKKTIPPGRRVVYDSALAHNVRKVEVVGAPGYVVTSYRLTYEGGVLVKREILATDEYRPRNWVIRVGA